MNKIELPELERHPDIYPLLKEILSRLKEVFGEKLIGLYLYGSLVAGDFDYEISDIDLLAATESLITKEELARLKEMHDELAIKNTFWEDRIEVAYVSRKALQTFKNKKSVIASISPGEPLHFLKAGRDWLLNWYFVRESGIKFFGVSPETIIPEISKSEFICAVREQVMERGKDVETARRSRPFQAYLIMTICRALYAVENGEQTSKRRSASWVQKEFPEYARLIEKAFEWRADHRQKNIDHEATFPGAKKLILFLIDQVNNGNC